MVGPHGSTLRHARAATARSCSGTGLRSGARSEPTYSAWTAAASGDAALPRCAWRIGRSSRWRARRLEAQQSSDSLLALAAHVAAVSVLGAEGSREHEAR